MKKKNLFLLVPVLISLCVLIGTPGAAATTELHIVKYANDGATIISETTKSAAWMEENLPVYGDGITHYYHEGPNFTSSWVINEDDPAILGKDMGAVKGTNLRDLCNLVGGMSAGDRNVTLLASDGFYQRFAYSSIYSPPARAGPIVITWFQNGNYVNGTYTDGMRNVMFADTSVNPWGYLVFGLYDMHEAYPPEFWYYYNGDPATPSTTGLSVKNINRVYIYSNDPPPPVVTAVSPATGPVAGNTLVTITGTGLSGATAVKFGTVKNTSPITRVSADTITVKSPAHAPGAVHVRVVTPCGTSAIATGDTFTYVPAPTITAVSPQKGPTGGNTAVTIFGTRLSGVTAVKFGTARNTTPVTQVSGSKITVRSPAHAAGAVHVRVVTPGGTSAIATGDTFTYLSPPTVTAVSPVQGPAAGNTLVTITGTRLGGATSVRFGTKGNTTPITQVSAGKITVRSPAHRVGAVHIRVVTPGGISSIATGDVFTYR